MDKTTLYFALAHALPAFMLWRVATSWERTLRAARITRNLAYPTISAAGRTMARCYLPGEDALPVAAKVLLTPNEQEFLVRLNAALSDFDVLPQVAMGALVQNTKAHDWETIKAFQAKICDFVVRERDTGRVVVVIELDDRTHERNKDAKRDALLASAGIPTLRFESRCKPKAGEIRRIVKDIVARQT